MTQFTSLLKKATKAPVIGTLALFSLPLHTENSMQTITLVSLSGNQLNINYGSEYQQRHEKLPTIGDEKKSGWAVTSNIDGGKFLCWANQPCLVFEPYKIVFIRGFKGSNKEAHWSDREQRFIHSDFKPDRHQVQQWVRENVKFYREHMNLDLVKTFGPLPTTWPEYQVYPWPILATGINPKRS